MKELKVGERVTITLEVVEQGECTDCFFNDKESNWLTVYKSIMNSINKGE